MNFDLRGPAGRLEALIDLPPEPPRAAALVAHPHPQYGGTMRSRVVYEAAQGFVRAGAAALRFNFRGVGASEGTFAGGAGEIDDFTAALRALADHLPRVPLWAAGYSFGAWIATTAGAADLQVTALAAIAPPLDDYDFRRLAESRRPKLIIQAERDELCPLRTMHRFYAALDEPKELVVIDAADHAFDGKAGEVGDAIEDLFMDVDRPS